MAHLTTVFPAALSYGSVSTRSYSTTVVRAYSGVEERNQNWESSLHGYAIDLANRLQADLESLVDYYHAAAGKANTFNFQDPREYKSCPLADTPADSDQTLLTAAGGETEVQLIKNYIEGGQTSERKITRPIAGSVVVAIDGTPKAEGPDYSIDYDTGLITFTVALTVGQVVTAGYEFYTPVRFATDNLDVAIQTANCDTGLISSLSAELIEVRE